MEHFGKTWFVWLDTARLVKITTRADMTGFGSIWLKCLITLGQKIKGLGRNQHSSG